MLKKVLSFVSVFVLGIVVLVGCGNGNATGDENTSLVVGVGAEGDGLDPARSSDAVSQKIIQAMYVGLYSFDSEGSLVPELVEDVTISDDLTVYTFKIREDAKWSDGQPITADEFVYGVQRSLNPVLGATYAKLVFYLKNAVAAYDGTVSLDEVGVKALDEKTVEFTLEAPTAYFLQLLPTSNFYPARRDVAVDGEAAWALDPSKVVTSGAYKLKDYKAGDEVVLEKNNEYYNASESQVSQLTFKFMGDMQAQVAAFQTGEIDIATEVPSDIKVQYNDSKELVKTPLIVNYYVTLRQGLDIPTSDARVRQALSLAVDREAVTSILNGPFSPLFGLVPPGITNPTSNQDFREEGGNLVKEDVAKAQALLAEAGYPNGEGFPTLTYTYNPNQMHSDVAQALQAMWKTNLGINVELKSAELNVFFDDRQNGLFELARHAMSADYPDPTTYLNMYTSDSPQNEARINDAKYDEWMKKAAATTDLEERMTYLHEAEKVLIEENMYLIPLFSYGQLILVRDGINGIYGDPSGTVRFDKLTFQ